MGTLLGNYDPEKVNVAFNNRQLRMFGDSLFTLARSGDNVSLKVGVQGDATMRRHPQSELWAADHPE